ncbi:MAG: DGQHR domain-containing protein [Bauldia sp.]|nr:DGQHR domain-containing protein [Bauldia sp.]
MAARQISPLREQLANKDRQNVLRRTRRVPHVQRTIRRSEVPAQLEDGWFLLKELKASIRVGKHKEPDELLEDELWVLLSEMGFPFLSADRTFTIQYGPTPAERQQIDVLAVDDECALIVECKAAQSSEPRRSNFKTTIEALGGKKPGLLRELRKAFGKPKLKVGFLLVTRNYQIPDADIARMSSLGIKHLSDRDIDYYRELTNHLGEASRYQFNADIFAGQDIPELDNKVPAIEGRMGSHKYYAFSASPATLLKLGFVLHRTKSVRLTPSYQRLIKKQRLTKIQSFVEGGGFFPNSLLVNIETSGKKLQFDRAGLESDNTIAKLGVLHLPPRYRSIYIIDGQHRLYAFSGSPLAKNTTLPVVAFVNLDRREQLRLFMEINENQKAVNRNLKNTLDADLKWDSGTLKDRADGIKKQLALDIGDEVQSPLFGRVQVGEDEKTEMRNITLEALLKGINRTRFIGKFKKNSIIENGWFYKGDSDQTLERTRSFLFASFRFSQERLSDEWRKMPSEGAILSINAGITAYIWLLHDIVEHGETNKLVDPLNDSPAEIVSQMSFLLDGFVEYIKGLSFEDRQILRSKYGSGADTRLWRCMQKGIAEFRPEFDPPGMKEYWQNQSKQFNLETFEKVGDIETFLKEEVRELLESHYGAQWLKRGIPGTLFEKLHADAAKKNREIEHASDEKTPWDCMYIVDYRSVMTYSSNWSALFHSAFTVPGNERAKKDDKTSWLVRLNTIRNQNTHEHSVTEDDYKFVLAVHSWLLEGDPDDIRAIAGSGSEALEPTT